MIDLTQFEGHTPGPWYHSGRDVHRGGPNDVHVAVCSSYAGPDLSGYANARLIAAAPDLLAEVKRLRSLCDELACDLGKLSDQLAATNGGAL